ncbi:Os05g0251032 [Oryza sativa Japonica Group]|uniref:Os05g0251032 protein n=1 Tax=Oryza sativa subsp. japonica TaxID=39947 RepID=A0A0P0WK39_ORYSJ|nr:Os05g0251032 [Oryza sativa Japonica Group]
MRRCWMRRPQRRWMQRRRWLRHGDVHARTSHGDEESEGLAGVPRRPPLLGGFHTMRLWLGSAVLGILNATGSAFRALTDVLLSYTSVNDGDDLRLLPAAVEAATSPASPTCGSTPPPLRLRSSGFIIPTT